MAQEAAPVVDNASGALLTFDFRCVFPHKTWVSDWAADETYPAGFRYKVMSARHEDNESIELLIVLEHRDGSKNILKHYDVKSTGFDRVAETFVKGLAETHGVNFEEQDFRACRTAEDFEARAVHFGWRSQDQ
jgi:hypothetical protein